MDLRISLVAVLMWATPCGADDIVRPNAVTVYASRISEERTWQHVVRNPFGADYADAYLLAGSFARAWTEKFGGGLRIESEINAAWNFGDQDHFELNVAPVQLRWQRFPWSERLRTTAAFGLGASYATQLPEVELAIEGDTRQWLIFWIFEFTAGPADGPWSVVLRLHHRSTGWGLMGTDDGGMNAPGLGFRYEF